MAEAPDLAETVSLAIGGSLFAGWTDVTITRSLDALCGTFELSLVDRAKTDADPFSIRDGDAVRVQVGADTIITGWIDAIAPSFTAESHDISVSGRDRTADLVDCSAVHKASSWRKARIEAIAAELAAPFGIGVVARASTGAPVDRFALQQGETVHAALERLMRFRGLLLVPTPAGDLEIITPADSAPVAVVAEGANITSASATFDQRDRFGEYIVKGQASGSDDRHGRAVTQIRGAARDPGVTRYRPMIVIAEDQSDGISATTRAQWEAGVRAGRSVSIEVTVPGWRPAPGADLWRPNTRVTLRSLKVRKPDNTMLVTAVRLAKGAAGTLATLTLMPPEAWQPLTREARP